MEDNKNVYERAKALAVDKHAKTTQSGSVYERAKALATDEGVAESLGDLGARIGANAEAYNRALANKDYEKAKADTKKMLNESTLGTKPYATSEDVQQEELQRFMDDKANEARMRGVQDYLDSTIGAWSEGRVGKAGKELIDSVSKPVVDIKTLTTPYKVGEEAQIEAIDLSYKGLPNTARVEASKIVKDYLAENPHMEANKDMLEGYVANNIYNDTFKWKLENDEQFFADAYEAITGKSYKSYKREVDEEAVAKLQGMKREVKAMNEALKKKRDEGRTHVGQSRAAFSSAWNDLRNAFGGNIESIENLIDEIDNVVEGSFTSGFDKGFDFDRMATVGMSGIFTEKEMAEALSKARKGEPLTEEEENYVRIHQYAQELNQLKEVREKYAEQLYDTWLNGKVNFNSIGEGIGTTVEMMPEFALAMKGTGTIGRFAKLGGKAARKAALEAGGTELFKYGVKSVGKLGYNYGLAKARGLVVAPIMPSTYNTYLESLNSAYSFDDEGNLTYAPVDKTQQYFGAISSTANEVSSEYLGIGIGKVLGWGARGVGRMVANTRLAEVTVDAGKKARKYLPKLTPQAKVAMRTLGVQADPVSETLSEALGDIMTSYEQSMIGMDVDMSQYGTFDYWMTLAGVTLAYGGSIAALGATKSYIDVKNAVKQRDKILGEISNRNLYNTLLAVSTSDDVVLASSALADFDWEGNGIDPNDNDFKLARAFRVADLNVKIMEGMVGEETRLGSFRGTIEGVRDIVYQGKAGEYSDMIFEAEVDGKKVYVINGFEKNSNTGQRIVYDPATGEKTSVDASKVKLTREISVDDYIDEAYANAFSLDMEKERIADIKEKALQMDNPTEKDVQRVASTMSIALPKVGNTVMLANGNMGEVTEVLSPAEFVVRDVAGATYKVHFTDILSTDKLTATAQGAMARGEVSTAISPANEAAASTETAEAAEATPEANDENGIAMGAEVTIDGRVGKVRARTQDGRYAVAFEAESGNYEDAEIEFFTGEELASLMGITPAPTAEAPAEASQTAETTTEVATTEDGRVDVEQLSAEEAAKVLIQRAGNIEEAIAQVKQVIEAVTEERKKAAKAEKKTSLNDIGTKSAELQALDARLEFFGEVLGVLEVMLAEQQKQTKEAAQRVAEKAGVAAETPTPSEGSTTTEGKQGAKPTVGLIRNGAEMKFTDKVIEMVDFVAKRLGLTVEFVDDLKNEAGQKINGDIKGKHVRLSTSGSRGIKFITGHEFFHRMKDLVDEKTYNDFVESIKAFIGEKKWKAVMAHQRAVYRAHNARVAKDAMKEMSIEEVAKIAALLNVGIEGLSQDDAKAVVAHAASKLADNGDATAYNVFPQMLKYSDALMTEECAADIAGELVTNTRVFSDFVENNKSNYALVRGFRKAIRAMREFFDSFGYTEQQRKLKALDKMLETTLKEAVANEAKGEKKPVAEVGQSRKSLPSLVGVHNISLDKLRKVIKMGGLANPSVAVIDVDKQTHVDYGEYSLILPKNMVDARQGKNAGTWAGDAWTPTYPQVVKRMNDDKAMSRFYKDIDALPEAMRSRVRLDFDSFMDGRSANALAYWYLFEKGNAPEIALVPSRYSNDVTNAVSEATKGSFSMFNLTPEERAKCLDAYIAVKFGGDRAAFEAEMQTRIERLAETIETKKSDRVKKWAQDTIDSIKEYGFDYDDVAKFIRDVEYDAREKGKVNVDATITAARERIKANGLEADYDTWRNNLDERYGIEEYIFDGYTNSGNRRYLPHTVGNASKWMKKQGRQGAVATFPSFGTFVAVSIPKMTTLESIRKRKTLLGKSKEEYDAFREKWENVYYELGKKLQPDAKSFEDYGYWRLIEAVGQKNPKEFIKKEYGVELSEEDMTQLNEMLNAIRTDYPARYFETKFERPLQLSDFTAAVVPNDIPLDVESRLKDAGVVVIEYEKGDNASRAEAMQKASQMENVRFSLIGEQGAGALDRAEETTTRLDNLAVAREMETEGKDAKAIRMATGWERGADGLWRYEIMDAEVNLYDGDENTIRKKIEVAEEEEKDFMQQSKADTKELRERTNTYLAEMREKYGVAEGEETDAMTEEEITQLQSLTNKEIEFEDYKERRRNELYNRRMALEAQLGYVSVKNSEAPAEIATTRLGHILQGNDAEMLFTAHPSLRDIEVQFVTDIRDGAFAAYVTKGGYKRIELNAKKAPVDMIAPYILHEVQHAIQDIEGFAGGGNLSSLQSDENVTAKEAYDYYRKIAGEVEARNVSARINMTPEERRATLLSETEDVAREDQIFLREGAEMAMAKNVGLPKEEYAKLSSTIMERQHIYGRPSFDYATTFDNFYVYDYLGDGDSIVNFAIPIVGNEEIIDVIYKAIDNGTINSSGSLDTFIEEIQSGKRGDIDYNANALKKYERYRGVHIYIPSSADNYTGGVSEVGSVDSRRSATRGESGNSNESGNQELTTRHSLITPEMDAAYLDAVERGDMETAQRMVMEAAKLAMPNTKVVDEDGNPKVVWHGTPNNFNAFSKEMFGTSTDRGIWGNGFYFSDSEQYAKTYEKRGDKQGKTLSVFLNIENPLFISLRNGGNEGAMYFHELMEKHFTDDIYEDATRTDELMSVAQERLTADIVAKGYDGIVVEYTNHIDTEYVAFEPNQIKSADPVTYDDNGNVIPLSERFNPRKEDIRYSLGSVEPYASYAKNMARALNIAQPIIVVDTAEEMVHLMRDLGSENAEDGREARGVYRPSEDAILLNAERFEEREDMYSTILHEWTHAYTQRNIDKLKAVLASLDEARVREAGEEALPDYYKNAEPLAILNEIISNFVARIPKPLFLAIMRGQMPIETFVEETVKNIKGKEYADIIEAVLPVIKENLANQKERYNGKREEPIVIARWVVGDSTQENERPQKYPYRGRQRGGDGQAQYHTGNDRGGAREDAQEVTRYMLPDPDPSEVFYDEIPIFDEQGNEIDFNSLTPEEAKKVLDGKVRQMLEAEYDHNVSTIRNEAREARAAVNEAYREAKSKRRKGEKAARTNAARIDEIFGDTPFESLPYEVQALILIATGEAKIYWGDKGNKRGLASELGLKGSTGDRHAYRNIWGGAKKSFDEVVHSWWESIGGYESGVDTNDLRNALISALQSVQSSKDAMQEIVNKYDDLATDRDNALAEIDRNEEKELHEAKSAYEQHLATFELAEGEERAAYHDRAAQFFGNQSLSRVEDILEDLAGEIERNKRKIERLKAENKDVYGTLAEGIQKSKDIILHALERLRLFAGMEEVDLNDVARLINLVKTARSQRQMNDLSAQATALVQRVSIKKAKTNLMRLLSLKLSNTDIIHKILKESDTWTKEEREAILKHLWKVSRNGLRVSKAVHKDTKEIFDALAEQVKAFKKETKNMKGADLAAKIQSKLAELEKEMHPEVVYDGEGNVQDNANLPTDFNAENKRLSKYIFKSYLEMAAKEAAYHEASATLREKINNGENTAEANADVVVTRENYLHALTEFNSTLEHLIVKGKDELRDWNVQKEKHEIEIRSMGIRAIGGEKASGQGKRSKWGARQRARWNATANAPYWTFETVLEKIDHHAPYKKGKMYTYFMDKWADANDDLITRYAAHFEEMAEAMRKCFPNDADNILKMKRNPYKLFQYIMRKAESKPIGILTYKEMGEDGQLRDAQIVLNIANAMYIIAMWRQPRYQKAMKEKHQITQSDIDALMANIASVDAGFLDFMDWVNEKFLPSTRLEYDVVYRKMNGGSMPKEINYFPARVAGHKEVDLANIDNGALPTTPSALKDRVSAHIMPQLGMDYFKVLESHIQDMDNWAAFAELTSDLNVLLSSDEFRRRCNEYMGGLGGDGGGKGSIYDLFKQTSLIATGMYRGDAGIQQMFGQLQKAWATSNIAFRYWTAVKQISSVTTGLTEGWRIALHMGKAASLVGIYSEIKSAMEISPSLRYRWKSGAAGMEALMRETQREDGYTVQRGAYEKTKDALSDFVNGFVRAGMTPNAAVDLLACSIIVNTVYETEIARLTGGKREATEAEKRAAVRKAERAFNTTQQSSEGAYLAPVQANPAYGVLTTYMNASFALHRKRMGGIKELWKLATSKEYRRYLKDEFGVDAAKVSAVDAFKDIISGLAGELGFAAMGWGLMAFMSTVNGWLNEDDDDEDVAAAKQEFLDASWQFLFNGYLGGSAVSSIFNGFDMSLTPAYDEFAKDVKGVFDDNGNRVWEVAQMATKYGLGVDLKALQNIGAGLENMFLEEKDEDAGAVLKFLNAPNRYIKAFVGDRRDGETLEEYQTRIIRFNTLFEDVVYEHYFDKRGNYIGENAPSLTMSKKQAKELRKEYEAAYAKNIIYSNGGSDVYQKYMKTNEDHAKICELLGWSTSAKPSKEKRYVSDMHAELAQYQADVAYYNEKRINWIGSEDGYYDLLMDEQKAKKDLIDNYYEYIKQAGIGAY